jgi:hypothetical protein
MTNQIQVCSDWAEISDKLYRHINTLAHYRNKAQLQHMVANIGHVVKQISVEEIECRRLQKQTIKHKELVERANTIIDEIEHLITFATLLDGTPDDR